jgi:hypothetical protein
MLFSDDLEVDRKEHSLIVRSERRIDTRITGALLGGLGVPFLWLWIKAADQIGGHWYLPVVWMVWMVWTFICLSLAVPRVVTTVVDLQSRQVLHDLDSVWGWYRRHRSCAFADVAGVGIERYSGRGGVSYRPVIVMTDHRAIKLGAGNGGPEGQSVNVADIICAATGWHTVDIRFPDDLEVDRKEHSLIVRSERRIASRITAVVYGGLGVVFLWLLNKAADQISGYWYVLMVLMVLTLTCISLYSAVPRVVTTVVDLQSRQVLHDLDSVWGWYRRHRSYAFADVAGVGIKRYYDGRGGVSYMPVIVMTDRRAIDLGVGMGGPKGQSANVTDIICATTGWPIVNVRGRHGGS